MRNSCSRKLIVSDLDGTFLGENSGVVPQNIDAVRAFQEAGGRFAFATGRTPHKLRELVPGVQSLVSTPIILLNGTVLYDMQADKTLFAYTLDLPAIVDCILSVFQSLPVERVHFVSTDATYILPRDSVVEIKALQTCNKIIFVGESGVLYQARKLLEAQLGEAVSLCNSTDFLLELLPPGAGKGVLLDKLREHICDTTQTPLQIYAIGDYENDLDLLMHADKRACPSNAIESVRQIADRIYCHHAKGAVAELISDILTGKF